MDGGLPTVEMLNVKKLMQLRKESLKKSDQLMLESVKDVDVWMSKGSQTHNTTDCCEYCKGLLGS